MKTKDLIFISLFTSLAIAGAFLRISLPFLSITFQLLFSVLAGIILGPVKGMIAMIIYLFLGLVGFPVFSLGGGLGYVTQPSFGFILGFIPGAFVSGLVYNKLNLKPYTRTIVSFLAGAFVVYIVGITYMFFILKFYLANPEISLATTTLNVAPYILKDIVLAFIAASLGRYIPTLRKLVDVPSK
ncbi:MAG: biotin transporter BioY [Clostridiales bacterium]|nr:biotin transporter BioY [Clostridiales bacterium]